MEMDNNLFMPTYLVRHISRVSVLVARLSCDIQLAARLRFSCGKTHTKKLISTCLSCTLQIVIRILYYQSS